MDWKDLKKLIGKSAPVLGAALAGPAGGTVGNMVANLFGVEPEPQQVANIIEHNPQVLVSLKQFEMEHQQELKQLAFETLVAELKDTQHAREQHKDHWMPAVLTIVLALMVVAMFTGFLVFEISEKQESLLYLIAGQVLTAFLTCVAFWVGTSRSSQEKNRLLRK